MVILERGAGTRRRILAVAVELFSSKSYAGTSIRDIAERTGVTKAALYYHFGSKEEILDALTEPFLNEFKDLCESASAIPPPSPDVLLGTLVDILSRRASLIGTVMTDPSIPRRQSRSEILDQFRQLARGLSQDDDPLSMVRARAALGAVHFSCIGTARASGVAADLASETPDVEHVERLIEGSEHVLSEDERRTILAAALRTLD